MVRAALMGLAVFVVAVILFSILVKALFFGFLLALVAGVMLLAFRSRGRRSRRF